MPISLKCMNCHKAYNESPSYFKNKHKNNFCSQHCREEFASINIKCEYCGKITRRTQGYINSHPNRKHFFCNKTCRINFNNVPVSCSNCGKTIKKRRFRLNLYRHLFCNNKCRIESKLVKEAIGAKNKIKMKEKWANGIAYEVFNVKKRKGRISEKKGKTWEAIFGKERSEELKKKVIESGCNVHKGKENHFFGRHHTMESINKIRNNNHLGRKLSEEHKRKIGRRGEKSGSWKGGITKLGKHIRNSNKYKSWRLKVFERDLFTCQCCTQRGGYLEVHHKELFSKLLQENNIKSLEEAELCGKLWSISNGVTYCKKCHAHMDKFRARLLKEKFEGVK